MASSLRPNRILSKLGGRVRQHVVDIEVLPERRAVDHSGEVLVKCLPRLPFGIRHARMLDFNVYAGRRFDVCAMDFSVRRDVRDFPTVNGETVLPFPMPLRLILPPRIAVAAAAMCSMMDHSRAAFGDHSGVAGRTVPSSTRKVLLSFTIHQRVLHGRSCLRHSVQKFSIRRSFSRLFQLAYLVRSRLSVLKAGLESVHQRASRRSSRIAEAA